MEMESLVNRCRKAERQKPLIFFSAETKLHITKKYIEFIDKIPELIENEPTLWKNEEPYIHEFANKKEED